MIRTDEEIKREIVDELCWDNRVDASKIKVIVKNGNVELTGNVPTFKDISTARAAARNVADAGEITENLSVTYATPPDLPGETRQQVRIENVLRREPSIEASNIIVSVTSGRVTLEGTVSALWKKSLIQDLVSSIRGVVHIDNRIAAASPVKVEDQIIAEEVMEALEKDELVDAGDISAEVKDGVVTLSGSVSAWKSRREAEQEISFIKGVTGVKNMIDVDRHA